MSAGTSNISRNRFWGESDDRVYRSAICTCTFIAGRGFHLMVDPSLSDGGAMRAEMNRRTGKQTEELPVAKHHVGTVAEIGLGQRKIVEGRGDFPRPSVPLHASGCPSLSGKPERHCNAMPSAPGEYLWARDGEILRCPWHGWEFDGTNGRSILNPHRVRVRAYEVTVEAGGMQSDEDPQIETYTLTVEEDCVVLQVGR